MNKKTLNLARFFLKIFEFNEKKHIRKSLNSLPKNSGLCLIDIGAAEGIEKRWQPFSFDLNYFGFEPDKRSFEKLKPTAEFKSFNIFQDALWSEDKEIEIFLCKDPLTSSFYKPNRDLLDKFPIPNRFDIEGSSKSYAKKLDNLKIKNPHFIKIDIQGGELEVLKGAKENLKKTLGLELEVEFIKMYKSQPLFGDVCEFLRDFDLEFIDFVGTRRWLRKEHLDIGQYIFADALFLKSPENVLKKDSTEEDILNYLKILLVYRRFDLLERSIELLDDDFRNALKNFLESIKPLKNNFNRIHFLNRILTLFFRFFGVNFKSHLIY